jgi:hypothetical protein
MNNEITNYIDNYKNKAFKTGSYFPDNKRYISNGFHSETIINEIVEKFGLSHEFTKQFVHEYLLRK